VLENDPECPAAQFCHHFVTGSIRDFDTVYQFGKNLDAVTIEIENVNIEALEKLESEGINVFPKPAVLRTIKNKIIQKEFYRKHEIPSPAFIITQNRDDVKANLDFLPAVHKLGEGGYDGRGVQLIREASQADLAFDQPGVLEKMVDIAKEIAIIVAIDQQNKTTLYPPVEMHFDPALNLLDFQICPADLTQAVLWKAEAVALSVARNFQSPGLFAIELFLDKNGNVFVNETAPRVHNSGHHSIEANYCSQFDMLWRIMLGYPLGNTDPILPSVMINLVGEDGYSGPAVYEGLREVLEIPNAFVHIYGKKETKPGRKMGHVTVISAEKQDLLHKANKIKHLLKVLAEKSI